MKKLMKVQRKMNIIYILKYNMEIFNTNQMYKRDKLLIHKKIPTFIMYRGRNKIMSLILLLKRLLILLSENKILIQSINKDIIG